MDKKMKILVDLFILAAAIVIVVGIVLRLMAKGLFGIQPQAFLQFTQALLLFALAVGIRQLLRKP
jgi:hypothetical protein